MITERDSAIRALLVETASRAPRRRWRGTAVVAVVAFLLGGGVAAGAISATADTPTDSLPTIASADLFLGFLHGGRTLGPLVSHTGSGATRIDLGPRPAEATGIAVGIECGGSGTLRVTQGGEVGLEQECTPGGAMGFSSEKDPTDSFVSVATPDDFRLTVVAQWIVVPAPAAASAAQRAAIADGVVTEAEFHAAVDRFSACMTGAGYPLFEVKYSPTLSYGASTDATRTGAIDRCQDAELSQVEKLWYKEH